MVTASSGQPSPTDDSHKLVTTKGELTVAESGNRPQRHSGDAADDAAASSGSSAYRPEADDAVEQDAVSDAQDHALNQGAVDPDGAVLGASGLQDPAFGELAPDEDEAEELLGEVVDTKTPDVAEPSEAVVDDVDQLTAAERAAAKAKSSRPVKKKSAAAATATVDADAEVDEVEANRPARNQSVAPVKKQATKQSSTSTPVERGPIAFTKQSIGELKKVVWPTAEQTTQYFLVVLVFVVFIMLLVWGLDTLFGWIMLKLFS